MSTKPRRIRMEAALFPIPQTRDECIESIAEIGKHQRERQRIEAAMNDELAKLREGWEARAKPHADAISNLTKGVQVWCEANRATLTQDGKTKTHKFATGEVHWRLRPKSVTVRGEEAVLEALHQLGLVKFIRQKEEVNKEAILADPESAKVVRGISVNQKEDFTVEPWETSLENVA